MRLSSGDGTVVDVYPLRYQFGPSPEPRDWDANWLVMSGKVVLPDGRSWSFTDPCLTTWEARKLGSWLQGVLCGDGPRAKSAGEDDERLLVFTEPNLAFSLAGRRNGSATVRIHFSLESSPPWLPGDSRVDRADRLGFSVDVQLTQAALVDAAASWNQALAEFPIR